jgi:hypothetical protein
MGRSRRGEIKNFKNSSHVIELIQIWRVLVNCIKFFFSLLNKLLYRTKTICREIYGANQYVIN